MADQGDDLARVSSTALAALSQLALPVQVRIGSATMTVGELLELRAGAVVTLDRALDDPVEVQVGGRTVAWGELVAIDEEMGVRITQIVAAPEEEP
ncbi:MAG: FliM/FliN family flagellar motor C-terminal domain-containing protein [Armatimonadota bacterium]